jgi:hypothetical protein
MPLTIRRAYSSFQQLQSLAACTKRGNCYFCANVQDLGRNFVQYRPCFRVFYLVQWYHGRRGCLPKWPPVRGNRARPITESPQESASPGGRFCESMNVGGIWRCIFGTFRRFRCISVMIVQAVRIGPGCHLPGRRDASTAHKIAVKYIFNGKNNT